MLSSAGYEMVIFFFVLSGFFIRYAQLKKNRPALRFYLNRVVRIFPPYLASLVLAGAVLAYLAYAHPALLTNASGRELNAGLLAAQQEMKSLTWFGLGRMLLFMQPGQHFFGYNNVYWSLLPEALFYLLVPLAFRHVRAYYVLSAVGYGCGILATALHLNTGFLGSFLFLYNGYFALGVGLYDFVTQQPKWLATFRRVKSIWLVTLIPGLVLLLIGTAALKLKVVSGPLAALLAVLSTSLILAGRVSRQNLLVRALRRVGLFSFSLYLYHFPLLILTYAGLVATTGLLVNYSRYYWAALPLVTLGCFAFYYITENLAVQFFRRT